MVIAHLLGLMKNVLTAYQVVPPPPGGFEGGAVAAMMLINRKLDHRINGMAFINKLRLGRYFVIGNLSPHSPPTQDKFKNNH